MTIVLLGLGLEVTGGCATASLLEMGDAQALVLLPLTLTFDALRFDAASAAAAGRRKGAAPALTYSMSTWGDPDDWVETCEGPLLCPAHKHFVCRGEPDRCTCLCEVTEPEPTAARQAAARHVERRARKDLVCQGQLGVVAGAPSNGFRSSSSHAATQHRDHRSR